MKSKVIANKSVVRVSSSKDILSLQLGDVLSIQDLFHTIQYSKVIDSEYWMGSEFMIGNTPQQGINWIGPFPDVKAVIIKVKPGAYKEDGWVGSENELFRYSFKAVKGVVNVSDKANSVLFNQPKYLYPILLFAKFGGFWSFEGRFTVASLEESYILLRKEHQAMSIGLPALDDLVFQEGGKKYVLHLSAERNRKIVSLIKALKNWECEICSLSFSSRYGMNYIEAHHKVSIATYNEKHDVKASDFAMLCPNCHKAVHHLMREEIGDFDVIKRVLQKRLGVLVGLETRADD